MGVPVVVSACSSLAFLQFTSSTCDFDLQKVTNSDLFLELLVADIWQHRAISKFDTTIPSYPAKTGLTCHPAKMSLFLVWLEAQRAICRRSAARETRAFSLHALKEEARIYHISRNVHVYYYKIVGFVFCIHPRLKEAHRSGELFTPRVKAEAKGLQRGVRIYKWQ